MTNIREVLASNLKKTPTETAMKNSQRAAIEDVSEDVNRLLADLFAKKIRQYSTEEASVTRPFHGIIEE